MVLAFVTVHSVILVSESYPPNYLLCMTLPVPPSFPSYEAHCLLIFASGYISLRAADLRLRYLNTCTLTKIF